MAFNTSEKGYCGMVCKEKKNIFAHCGMETRFPGMSDGPPKGRGNFAFTVV